MTVLGNLIKPDDFCEVVTDRHVEDGLKRGHHVFVVGSKALPEEENDPYTQRIKFFVHPVGNDKHVDLEKLHMLDPKSMQKVSDSKQKKFSKILKEDLKKYETPN